MKGSSAFFNMHLKEYRTATEITALFTFCAYLFYPVLGPYVKGLGLSEMQIGFMFALFPLTLIFASSFFGTLSDSVGRRKIIIFGIISEILGLVMYLSGIWYLVILGRFFEAVAFAAVIFVGLARIHDSLDEKTRGKYSGISLTLMYVGRLVAPVLGGLIADYWFVKGPFIFSAFALLMMLWLVSLHEKIGIGHRFTRSDFNLFEKVRTFLSYRGLFGMGILGIVMHASLPLSLVFIPIFITEHFGLPFRFVGYSLFAMEFFMFFQFVVGRLCDRFDSAKLTLLGVVIYGAGFVLLSFAASYWVFVGVMLLIGIGGAFWNVSALSFMSDVGEGIRREGLVIGTYVSIAKIGAFLSFVFGGIVIQRFGVQALMFSIGIMIIAGAIAASFFMIHKPAKKVVKR